MLLVCYVLLYVAALCVKMRHVILSIKRLLIDATNLLGDAEVLEFESEPAGGRQSYHISYHMSNPQGMITACSNPTRA